MKSPFQPYPRSRGPVKLLLYGDPGTLKTRRALGFPGPRFMIDLEKGADEYGDLCSEGDQYMTASALADVDRALDYLDTLPAGSVGTLIVDPITVLWSSLQAGYAERQSGRKKIAPEEVIFDQGVWSRLNRTHNDLVARLLNAPWHVIMIARGKAQLDNEGREVGYAHEGHRSLDFLAKTVIRARRDGDVLVKDRTGTWPEGHRAKRLDLLELLARAGTGGARLPSASDGARADASTPQATDSSSPRSSRPSRRETSSSDSASEGQSSSSGGTQERGHDRAWNRERSGFFGWLGNLTEEPRLPDYETWAPWCEEHTWTDPKAEEPAVVFGPGRPSQVSTEARRALLRFLAVPAHRQRILDWLEERDQAIDRIEREARDADPGEVAGG